MNTTKNTGPSKGFGSFAPSGFFKKFRARANVSEVVYRTPYEAATPAQAARLIEVLGRGRSSQPRF